MIIRGEDGFAQTADAVVLAGSGEELSLLVVRRKYEPYQNTYAFPGGFLDRDELPLVACIRELVEETGLDLNGVDSIALSVREKQGRDPRGLTRTFPFLFLLEHPQKIKAADDALEVHWIPLISLKSLAFDHGAILCEALALFWRGMHTFKVALKLPYVISPKGMEESFLFYGGTFNPWHAGHSECINQGSRAIEQSVTVVPDHNPLKQLIQGECFWHQYLQMVERFSATHHAVYPGFLGQEHKNPTALWISQLASKPSFIIGDDNLQILYKWVEFELFLNSLQGLMVVPRSLKQADSLELIKKLKQNFPNLMIKLLRNHSYQKLSSTALRI